MSKQLSHEVISPVDLPSSDMPVPAMLAGLGLRGAVAGRLGTRPPPDVDNVVEVDMALPGREPLRWPCPPGVTLPEREPNGGTSTNTIRYRSS